MSDNARTSKLIEIKKQMEVEFESLIDSFAEHGDDGICISDIEFALHEFKARIYELECAIK